ncbi:MAG: DUF3631 domain-containing protein, partial [Pseudonocardia sp.]
RIRLLGDCHTAFDDQDALPTSVLLQRLKADPEAPWCDYGRDGLTAMKLGGLLRDYDIRSANIRFPGLGRVKGYYRADFLDAWARYCPRLLTPDTADLDAVPGQGGSRTSRTSLITAGQRGEACSAGTAQAVPAHQAVPGVPGLTRENAAGTAGTAGTAHPLHVVSGERRAQ